eukprot:jgi/Psemu1/38265/gm1.38265_g
MSEQDIINAFKVFDADETGKVKSEDVVDALTTFGTMSTDEAEKLIKDAGGKSSFDYTKFVQEMNAKAQAKADNSRNGMEWNGSNAVSSMY